MARPLVAGAVAGCGIADGGGLGALHGWIVPRIGNYRAQLQEQATQVLGVPVRLGTVTARTEGLIPTVELGDVALLDPQGREALRLPRVVLAVSPRSLWKFGFEQLYIDSPELDIRRTPEGRILLAGLELPDQGPNDGAAADWFFSQPELVIRGGTLRWTDELRGAPPWRCGMWTSWCATATGATACASTLRRRPNGAIDSRWWGGSASHC
jgi:uncharacterized protein YhdP